EKEVPASVGRVSLTVTLRAMPAPEVVTVMVNAMGSPAEAGEASAVLGMAMEAHSRVTEAEEEASPRFPEESVEELPWAVLRVAEVAVLSTVPQVAAVVGEVMWTWTVAAAASSTGP